MGIMIKSSKVKQDKQRKAYKFRLIVNNNDIERQLTKIIACCRFVWNKALAVAKQVGEDYRKMVQISNNEGISPLFKFNPHNQLSAFLATWKQQSEIAFLKQAYSKSLQIVLKELGQDVDDAKNKSNPKRYPVFKNCRVKDNFSWNNTIKHDAENWRIFIPKIGIWYHKTHDILGTIKFAYKLKYNYVIPNPISSFLYRQPISIT
jgi:putative transposase